MEIYGEVKQRQQFYHHGDTICHPKSGYVTTKLHGKSTCRCHNNAIFSDSYFQVSRRLCMAATLIRPQRSLRSSCEIGKIAALLNSLFFVFKISFLPKYRANPGRFHLQWFRLRFQYTFSIPTLTPVIMVTTPIPTPTLFVWTTPTPALLIFWFWLQNYISSDLNTSQMLYIFIL